MIVNVKDNKEARMKAVTLSNICASEHLVKGPAKRRLLNGISFEVLVGECVGISSEDPIEARLLLEIIANIRPYYSGNCVLAEKGMMQAKRLILPHLFYIDTPHMLYGNMSVLEFLMFATNEQKTSFVTRQKRFLQLLIDLGLESQTFSQISSLSDTQKIIIELIIAAESGSTLVILNMLDYIFSIPEIQIVNQIFNIIQEHGSVIVGTTQAGFIGICCDKVGFIIDGSLKFFGNVSDLCKSWDKVLYLISDPTPEITAKKLSEAHDDYSYVVDGKNILVYNYSENVLSDAEFMRLVLESGIRPDNIKINKGRVGNSFEELSRLHDL